MGLTKFSLKRPVTTILVVLCLIVFGIQSVLSAKLELMPTMDMPMLIIATVYPGARCRQYPWRICPWWLFPMTTARILTRPTTT